MGVQALYCCFRNQKPICLAFTGLGASLLAFIFMIWGLADLTWFKKGVEAIYIIAFIFVCFCLLAFIAIVIFLYVTKADIYRTVNNIGRIFCFVILILSAIALIFMFVAFIILIVDYVKEEKDWPGKLFSGHEWAAVFLPSIIALGCLVVIALVANVLYKIFYDRILSTPNPVNITQNTVSSIPNIQQPGIFPNNGPVPSMGNVPYPVVVQQSQANINT